MTLVYGIKSDDLVDSTNPARGKEEMKHKHDTDIDHDEDGMSWMDVWTSTCRESD